MCPLFLEVKAAIYSVKKIVIQVLHVNIHAHRDSPLVLVYRDNQVEIYILPLMTECNMLHSNGRKFLSVFIVTESHRTVRGCHTRAQCRLCSSVLSRRSHDHGVSRPAHFVFWTFSYHREDYCLATCMKINTLQICTKIYLIICTGCILHMIHLFVLTVELLDNIKL